MKKFVGIIFKYPSFFALTFLLVSCWPLLNLANLRNDNSIDVWLDHSGEDYQIYREFEENYGTEEWFLVVVAPKNPSKVKMPEDVEAIASKLRSTFKGARVIHPFATAMVGVYQIRNLLLAPDQTVCGILLAFPDGKSELTNGEATTKAWNITEGYQSRYNIHLGGPIVLNAELDQQSINQGRLLISLSLVVSAIFMGLIFRSLKLVFSAMSVSGLNVAVNLGLMAMNGATINMVTLVVPVLIYVLTLAGSIHIITHSVRNQDSRKSASQAIREALERLIYPYTMAVLTTMIGFFALLTSDIIPVQNLGFYAGLGVGIGFLANTALLPWVLNSRKGWRNPTANVLSGKIPNIPIPLSFLHKSRWVIFPLTIFFIVFPLFNLKKLVVEANILRFFPENSRIVQDYQFIVEHLTGLSTIELDVRGRTWVCQEFVDQFKKEVRKHQPLKALMQPGTDGVRLSIFVETMDSLEFNQKVREIKTILGTIPASNVTAHITGLVVLLNKVQEKLLASQFKSFLLAFFIIMIFLATISKSWLLFLASVIVNILPVFLVILWMILLVVPVNVATMTVAAITFGIAVDDTVFFLTTFIQEKRSRPINEAISASITILKDPFALSRFISAVGFSLFMLSDFSPLYHFGLLGMLSMVAAWIGDAWVLPALLYLIYPRSMTDEPHPGIKGDKPWSPLPHCNAS